MHYDALTYTLATGKEKVVCEGRFPDWSPDGKKIAYVEGGSETNNAGLQLRSKIVIAAADGSGAEELCDGNWPSWSPNGEKMAYCVRTEAQRDLDHRSAERRGTEVALGHYRAGMDPRRQGLRL